MYYFYPYKSLNYILVSLILNTVFLSTPLLSVMPDTRYSGGRKNSVCAANTVIVVYNLISYINI